MSDRGGKHGKRSGEQRGGSSNGDYLPDFEVVLWGYDRRQVERCLDDLTARLEQALSQLDSVEVLQAKLCEAQLELEQLKLAAQQHPCWSNEISTIMMAAEELRRRAEREAVPSGS